MSASMINKLKAQLAASAESCGLCGCPLSNECLAELLALYPCYELALYEACMLLARDSSIKLADGTQTPSQSQYWLRLALSARPTRTGFIKRADAAGSYGR